MERKNLITNIEVENFKSFKKFNLNLNDLNIIIGENATGKSNFVEIFEFLRDIITRDFKEAIRIHGGLEFLPNVNIKDKNPMKIKLEMMSTEDILFEKALNNYETKKYWGPINKVEYYIEVSFSDDENFSLNKEYIKYDCELNEVELSDKKIDVLKDFGKASIKILNKPSKNKQITLNFKTESKDVPIDKEDIIPNTFLSIISSSKNNQQFSLLETPLSIFPVQWANILRSSRFYDFDPKSSKKFYNVSGGRLLKENGENLSAVLNKILDGGENERKFYNYLSFLLPFVDKIDVESYFDKTCMFRLYETQCRESYFPAFEVSDGTIDVISLIIALYFQSEDFIIIEELERNIHPYLISKILEMINEVSEHKQIILTTHSPEILKYVEKENILFIKRDENSFASVFRLTEDEDIKEFLEDNIGVDQLFIDNLIGD